VSETAARRSPARETLQPPLVAGNGRCSHRGSRHGGTGRQQGSGLGLVLVLGTGRTRPRSRCPLGPRKERPPLPRFTPVSRSATGHGHDAPDRADRHPHDGEPLLRQFHRDPSPEEAQWTRRRLHNARVRRDTARRVGSGRRLEPERSHRKQPQRGRQVPKRLPHVHDLSTLGLTDTGVVGLPRAVRRRQARRLRHMRVLRGAGPGRARHW
jgi:hypothetical protein